MALQNVFTDKAKKSIAHYTKNILCSLLIGIIVTILLGSSSATIIIAIVFINAGTLNFKQVIGIILGANIGTTFSSQLIAFNISKYSVAPLIIGFVLWLFFKSSKVNKIGEIIMFFGLLFFGLYLLENSLLPLKNNELFTKWILITSDPIKSVGIGGLVTLIIQSSSATVGILIVLAKQQLIGLSSGLAIMLGAELGTCSDTLIAVIGGKRDALRAGVFHLFFNLTAIIFAILFFDDFVWLIQQFSKSESIHTQIANGHFIFNALSVLLFLPFAGFIFWFISFIIPDKKLIK